MGKFTPEKIEAIRTIFAKNHSFTLTAKEARCDPRTVKRIVYSDTKNSATHARTLQDEQVKSIQDQNVESQNGKPQLQSVEERSEPDKSSTEHLQNNANKTSNIARRTVSVPKKSPRARAFKMFEEGATLVEVQIKLDISSEDVKTYYAEYTELKNLKMLSDICKYQPPSVISFIIRIIDIMQAEKMNVPKIMAQLKVVGPLAEALTSYQEFKNKNENLWSENQRLEARNLQLEAKRDALKREIVILEDKRAKAHKQCEINEQVISIQKEKKAVVLSEIQKAKAALNELTGENGSIRLEVRKVASEEARRVLEDNEMILSLSVSACMIALKEDAKPFWDFFNMYPLAPGEDAASYVNRYKPVISEVLNPIIKKAHDSLVNMVANYSDQVFASRISGKDLGNLPANHLEDNQFGHELWKKMQEYMKRKGYNYHH